MASVASLKAPSIISGIDLETPDGQKLLDWWSKQTECEPHMLTITAQELRETLLANTVAVSEGVVVAAAGIFPARTLSGEELDFNGQRVVELGSNIVLPDVRGQGIGQRLVEARLKIAAAMSWMPVCISTNAAIQAIAQKLGAEPMENRPDWRELQTALCLCVHPSPACTLCPLAKRSAWIFNLESP